MTKTLAILLGLASSWLVAWTIAGYSMHAAGSEKLAHVEHLSSPATRLEKGAEVRVEGTIAEGSTVSAPFSEKPCLAAVTQVAIVSQYRDIHNRPASDSRIIVTRRVGPAAIAIAVGDERVHLPLERWSPGTVHSEGMVELPPRLGVTREEIDRARAELRDGSTSFRVSEATLEAGTQVFVAGRLEAGDGPLRLEADPVLGRIEVFPGTRAELLDTMGGSGGGLRVAGWIVGAGVGPLPLAVLGLVLLARRREADKANPG